MFVPQLSLTTSLALLVATIPIALCVRMLYNVYWHPLAKFPGPWYAACSSLCVAMISVLKMEPQWMYGLVKKYGSDTPIRISPNLLLFPKPSSLREIYWDPKLNTKSGLYGTGMLGPPALFSTLDGRVHAALRKALADPSYYIGGLKKNSESKIDDLVQLFIEKMSARAEANDVVCLSDKVAEFAVDIMSMLSFTTPFGSVENQRDERRVLESWRKGLDFFGFAGRFRFFRNHIMRIPVVNTWLLPKTTNDSGMGWLMCQADEQVTRREFEIDQGKLMKDPDYLERCLNARIDGQPLSAVQRRAHVTLLIQAGADTTGTSLGSTLRFLALDRERLQKALSEIQYADKAGKLSTPIKYEETITHLPYLSACIKEGLRLNPPASNLFARVVPKEGKVVDGHFLPPETEISSYAYGNGFPALNVFTWPGCGYQNDADRLVVVQRDKELYAPDPDAFRPERWLESVERANELDAASYAFGMGPRVCLGKDVALMELHKLIPETIRRFDMELVKPGRYIIAGGVGYNQNFMVRLIARA